MGRHTINSSSQKSTISQRSKPIRKENEERKQGLPTPLKKKIFSFCEKNFGNRKKNCTKDMALNSGLRDIVTSEEYEQYSS